jgi:TRAP-type C4-dicarboxylate transport system permease small subunit
MTMDETGKLYLTSTGTIKFITRFSVGMSCILLFLMSFYIGLDVLVRKFLALSLQGSDELSGYVLAFVSVWGFSLGLLKKAHIRIELLYVKFPAKGQRLMDLLAMASLASFVWMFTYQAYRVLYKSIMRGSLANTPLQTPLWIPQFFWFAGLLFFSFVILAYILFPLYWFIKRDYAAIDRLIGCPVIEENIKEETSLEEAMKG